MAKELETVAEYDNQQGTRYDLCQDDDLTARVVVVLHYSGGEPANVIETALFEVTASDLEPGGQFEDLGKAYHDTCQDEEILWTTSYNVLDAMRSALLALRHSAPTLEHYLISQARAAWADEGGDDFETYSGRAQVRTRQEDRSFIVEFYVRGR